MQRQMFENLQSMSGISGINDQREDVSMDNNNDSHDLKDFIIKVNGPHGQLASSFANSQKQPELDLKKITTKNTINIHTTGYDINRELFSDEEIREAFSAIDINNDGALTAEELSFFLKCMDQSHTTEEVQEMIKMVSADGKRVLIDDFRKIGRGKMPPFAAISQPTQQSRTKQEVLENIQECNLTSMDPEDFYELKEELGLSRNKFQEEKAKRLQNRIDFQQTIYEEKGGMKQRTIQQLKMKKEQYRKVQMFNVERAVEALKTLKNEIVSIEEIADVLAITEGEARILFEKSRVILRQVMNDIILFSQVSNLQKLELILSSGGKKETLSLDDWVLLLCFMMGSDQRDFIKRRLENILKYRKISLDAKFDKYFVLQLMTKEEKIFLW